MFATAHKAFHKLTSCQWSERVVVGTRRLILTPIAIEWQLYANWRRQTLEAYRHLIDWPTHIPVIVRQSAAGRSARVSEDDGIPPCRTVPCRNDQRQMILGYRLELQPGRFNGARDDSSLGQPSRDRPHDFLAGALLEAETYARPFRQPGRETVERVSAMLVAYGS